ncbi:MAG: GrpB family protein [Enterobacteriaceae bacterium]|nr:GrpB family protein [Enterobacteriaceae bacterium]
MTGRRIAIEQSDPIWPERYQKEALLLQRVLSDIPVAIHHIGSTAVPGLAAKPIIDILLEVPSLHLLDKYNDTLRQAGYTPRGEYGIPGRRYFVKGENQRTHHLHAFELGSQHTLRHLAFRNYLRQHSDIAQEYERVKREAAEHSGNLSERYSQLKNDFIQRHEALALREKSHRQPG